jgi:hypothetical protein
MNVKIFPLLPLVGLLAAFPALADDAAPAPVPAPLPPEVQTLLDAANARKGGELRIDAADPLAAAWLFARQITGDHDVACQQQLRCVKTMIEAGRAEEAARLTRDIPDYRSALGSLHCAEALLEAGRKELALEQMDRVEKLLGVVKPWQQNVIRVRMAAVGAQAGWDDAKIAPWLKPLELEGDRFGARVLVLVRRMLKDKAFDAAGLEELMKQKFAQKNPVPEMVEAAGLLLRLAPGKEKERTDPAQMNALISGFETLLSQSQAYPALALLDLAEFWHGRGDVTKARAALARAEPQIGYHLDIGAELYHRMAKLWKLKGTANDVRPFFEKLEVKARALAPMYRPAALVWLGACWQEIGETDRCAVLTEEAVKEASLNPNPRMRLIGGVEVCLCHARNGRPLSAALVRRLTAVLHGDESAVVKTP